MRFFIKCNAVLKPWKGVYIYEAAMEKFHNGVEKGKKKKAVSKYLSQEVDVHYTVCVSF